MNKKSEFEKFAQGHMGISSLKMHNFKKIIETRAMTPYIMEERQLNVAQIDVFSRLMVDRIIWMCSPIEDLMATVIQAQLLYLESADKSKDINLYVDTDGGSIVAGLKVIDIMDYISCDVCTTNTGTAASMGAVVLAAGKKGKRTSLKHSKTMIHMSSGGAIGNIQDARIMMEEWEKYNNEIFDLLAGYCGKTKKQIMEESERDKWLSSEDAKSYGIIDSVIKTKKKKLI